MNDTASSATMSDHGRSPTPSPPNSPSVAAMGHKTGCHDRITFTAEWSPNGSDGEHNFSSSSTDSTRSRGRDRRRRDKHTYRRLKEERLLRKQRRRRRRERSASEEAAIYAAALQDEALMPPELVLVPICFRAKTGPNAGRILMRPDVDEPSEKPYMYVCQWATESLARVNEAIARGGPDADIKLRNNLVYTLAFYDQYINGFNAGFTEGHDEGREEEQRKEKKRKEKKPGWFSRIW